MNTRFTANNEAINEDLRMKQYIQQKQTENNLRVQNAEDDNQKDLIETAERFQKEKEKMEKAFEVSLSTESKNHAEKLAAVRASHEKELKEVKKNNENEFLKEEVSAEKRLQNFTSKQEEVIAKLHARYQRAQEEIRKNNGDV